MIEVRLASNFEGRRAEWGTTALSAWWGWRVATAPEIFSHPFYEPLARIADNTVWGVTAMAIGAISLAALIINGTLPRWSPLARQIACGFRIVLWWGLTIGAMNIGFRSPAVATYAVLAFLDLSSLTFAVRDGKMALDRRPLFKRPAHAYGNR